MLGDWKAQYDITFGSKNIGPNIKYRDIIGCAACGKNTLRTPFLAYISGRSCGCEVEKH